MSEKEFKKAGASPPQQTPAWLSHNTNLLGLPPLSQSEKEEFKALLNLYAVMDNTEKEKEFKMNKQQWAKIFIYYGAWKIDLDPHIKEKLDKYFKEKEEKKDKVLWEKIKKLSIQEYAYKDWWKFIVLWQPEWKFEKWERKVFFKPTDIEKKIYTFIVDKEKYPLTYLAIKEHFESLEDFEDF